MTSVVLNIADPSQTSQARRLARSLAAELGFDESEGERVAIVASEITTNLLKHAAGGRVIITPVVDQGAVFVDILGLDRGPGMSDVQTCFRDGYSTTGTAGTGMGAIKRLAAIADVYSLPGGGTAVWARVSKNGLPKPPATVVSGVEAAKRGEDVSGDAWGIARTEGRVTVVMADGLGHGPDAAAAARAAIAVLPARAALSPREIIETIHLALKHTRGAAVAVAVLDERARSIAFSGLGNINARICKPDGSSAPLVSMNGTAGMEARVVREFSYEWPPRAALVLHSDGLSSRWNMADYPGLLERDPSVISGVLFRDFCRDTDDASIVVAL